MLVLNMHVLKIGYSLWWGCHDHAVCASADELFVSHESLGVQLGQNTIET